jgi:3-oxoacyl-[acyl-carrier protein] reductase
MGKEQWMDLGLEGKRAIVAGASAGLGLGCAQALAAEGARVVLGSRSADRIEAAAATVPNGIGLTGDVSTVDGAVDFVRRGIETLGGIDILIANAGGPTPGNFESTDLAAYEGALHLNLLSTVAMVHTAIPVMKDQGWGRVLAITSMTVREPKADLILSNTARAGATAFLKTVATEVAPFGITVNSIQPGLHATERLERLGMDFADVAKTVPTQTVGDPGDFGRVAAFLCSEPANFLTGAAVPVDGGAIKGLQ